MIIISAFLIISSSFCSNRLVTVVFNTSCIDSATKFGETKIYVLKKVTENSDFNYSLLTDIDSYDIDSISKENIAPVFEPIGGRYRYYQFISTFVGESYNGDGPPIEEEFHDILILKTDDNKRIIDAYQYTLEWAETPLQYDLYKASVNNLELTDGMNIMQLEFKSTYKANRKGYKLEERGILKL